MAAIVHQSAVRHPFLAGLVDRVWYFESEPVAQREQILPTGQGQLIFCLHRSATKAIVQGPYDVTREVATDLQRRCVGVTFKPGGLAVMLRERLDLLRNSEVDLEDIWGLDASCTLDELAESSSPAQVIRRLEGVLAQRVSERVNENDAVVPEYLSALEQGLQNQVPIGELSYDLGHDRRTLTKQFKQFCGFGLKPYSRIRRVSAVVQDLRNPSNDEPLAVLAAKHGFSDQAHMSRELRRIGFSATELKTKPSGTPNHVSQPADNASR